MEEELSSLRANNAAASQSLDLRPAMHSQQRPQTQSLSVCSTWSHSRVTAAATGQRS